MQLKLIQTINEGIFCLDPFLEFLLSSFGIAKSVDLYEKSNM